MADLKQTIPLLQRSFDGIASSYDRINDTLADRVHWYVGMHHIVDHLDKTGTCTILDAGGGTGNWTIELAAKGHRLTLIDVSAKSVEVAREKAASRQLNVDFIVGNVEETDLPDATFDFILCLGPLMYSPEPQRMLEEMNRLLKPGGTMCLEFYNGLGWAIESSNLSFKLRMAMADEELIQMSDWDYPARVFSLQRVSELCQRAGFEVIKLFGTHILMASIPMENVYTHQYSRQDLEDIKSAELRMSERQDYAGASKICNALLGKR